MLLGMAFRRLDAHERRHPFELGGQVRNPGLHQRHADLLERRRIDGNSVGARDLDRLVVAEEIRQGDDRRHKDDAEDQQVLPQRIAVHTVTRALRRA
jgi:hypothetical protein